MFYRVKENRIYDKADWKYDEECLETTLCTQEEFDKEENQGKFVLVGETIAISPDWLEIEKAREQERLQMLSMTKLDFVTELEKLGITYEQIKALINSSSEAQKQWELCERVYRFNPLLDEYSEQLGITTIQLDKIFKIKGK